MQDYLNSLKNTAVKGLSTVSPTFAMGKKLYDYATKKPTATPVATAAPTVVNGQPAALPVAPTRTTTSANPAAVNPAVKTPAAQTYVQSQMSGAQTPTVPTPTTPQPTAPTYTNSPGSPSATGNSAMDSYITAYKNYIGTQSNNSEVSEAKKYLNKLILDDKMAREKALNSGETMGFAGGEEARVAKNNAFAIDAATGNLGVLQEEQTNNQNVAKTQVDLAKSLAEIDADASKTAYQKEQDKLKLKFDTEKLQFDQDMATKKFDEDVRQFGIKQALENRKQRLEESKAGTLPGSPTTTNSNLTVQPGYKSLNAKQKSQADSLNNLVRSLNEYKVELSNTTGGSGINLFGADSGLLQTKLNSILFAAAQAEGTGALQQADREVIEQIVPNPTNVKGAFNAAMKGGKVGSVAKIDDQINKYTANLAGFGLTPMVGAAPTTPTAGTTGTTSSGLKYTVTP